MIDKLGDDKCFRGAYAYHLAVRDKINELVEAVNKLESHKHRFNERSVGSKREYQTTSDPIMQSEELPIIEINNLNFATGAALAEAIRDIKDLKQVIQEVYYLADRSNFCGNGMDYRLKNIMDILKPYIEEK